MGNTIFCALLLLFFGVSAAAQPTKQGQTTSNSKAATDTFSKTEKPNSSQPLFTSKYDFVPGEKIVVLEDFSGVEPGDFPSGWNTNASAEVVTVSDKEGKWLKIVSKGSYYPEMIKSLPQNMTLEFYLQAGSKSNPVPFVLNFGPLKNREEFKLYDAQNPALRGQPVFQVKLSPGNANKPASSEVFAGRKGNYEIQNKNNFKTWDNSSNTTAHVALWRQADRLRIYINGEKVWDLQRAFDSATKYNIVFAMPQSREADNYYLLGNLRLAVGVPDTRNKLLKEGRFVTQGILFTSGSDQIKPESYGILKEIAGLLEESPSIRVKIIGHTDSDGNEKSNLLLSQQRAAAVKAALVNDLGIKPERLEIDGKGQAKPIADNKTKEGKAQNRRVEFIKI
jgi:outer membrane protein OmpA-like peptidoglycan-associated protein